MRYEGDSAYCFSCGYYELGEQEKEIDWDLQVGIELTEESHSELKASTTHKGKNFRGISDEVYKYFGVRHEYDTTSGELVAQYYPCTTNSKFAGYKRRKIPKDFDSFAFAGLGVGKNNDFFGQFRYKESTANWCLIVGGELDQLSAFQMWQEYVGEKSTKYADMPILSPTVGESCVKQVQHNYAYLNGFEKIILCLDSDKAGEEATEKLVKVLPKGKVFIAKLPLKDPNDMLTEGRQREFISAVYGAKLYTPAGVVGSDSIISQLAERAALPKVSLPAFMKKANQMLAGGLKLKGIFNVVAGTSIGKTTLVNAMVKHWIFNSPYKVGVITLEADVPEYGSQLLSEYIGRKLSLIEDPLELTTFLQQPEIVDKAKELFCKDDGAPRFFLIDDRGDFDSLQDKIIELIQKCDVQLIIIDPLSDALAGMSTDEQELFMKWMKQTVKAYDVTFVNVVHIRKAIAGQKDAGRGADLDESMMFGSSSIAKSADCNIMLRRNKYAESELERNTTSITISKNRSTGITGEAGKIYYEGKTHRLWDMDEWLNSNQQEEQEE